MATRRKRRRNLDNDLEQWIEAKARFEFTPAEIYRQMYIEPQFNDRENLPSQRTIQRIVEDMKIKDTTATWSIGSIKVDVENISLDDARLILDILRSVFLYTRGKKRSFTVREAQWVLKIAKLAPELFHESVWLAAQNYIYNEAEGLDTENLDLDITLNPEASDAHFKAWAIAEANGWYESKVRHEFAGRWPTVGDDILYELNKRNVGFGTLKPKEIAELFGATEGHIKDTFKDHEKMEVNDERTHTETG